jgi:hypothetical protein
MSINEDDLDALPLDPLNTPLSFREKTMFDSIYPKKETVTEEVKEKAKENAKVMKTVIEEFPRESRKVWRSLKDIIIASILFAILQFPFVDDMINKTFKTENFYYRILVKSAIFAVLFFVFSNMSLARMNNY